MSDSTNEVGERAELLIAALVNANSTIATAESLTGGLLAASLTAVPGASRCFRGGVVSYASDLKASLLGVDRDLLAQVGPVAQRVAEQMASGACTTCGSDVGIATTGVAGPTEQHGVAVGTVFVATWIRSEKQGRVSRLQLRGDRQEIRLQTVVAALDLAIQTVSA